MNELFLYGPGGIFQLVLKQSATIKGNYHISPNYGHDLNTNNLDQYLQGGKVKSYPIAVCMPPRGGLVRFNGMPWQRLVIQLFFLTLDRRNDDGTLKEPDADVFTSHSTPPDDWAAMRTVANEFLSQLQALQRSLLPQHLAYKQQVNIDYDRAETLPITRGGNDIYNGVSLTFSALIQTDICMVTDYGETFLETFEMPVL